MSDLCVFRDIYQASLLHGTVSNDWKHARQRLYSRKRENRVYQLSNIIIRRPTRGRMLVSVMLLSCPCREKNRSLTTPWQPLWYKWLWDTRRSPPSAACQITVVRNLTHHSNVRSRQPSINLTQFHILKNNRAHDIKPSHEATGKMHPHRLTAWLHQSPLKNSTESSTSKIVLAAQRITHTTFEETSYYNVTGH